MIALTETTIKLFSLNARYNATAHPATAVVNDPVAVKISGKVKTPNTAKGTY